MWFPEVVVSVCRAIVLRFGGCWEDEFKIPGIFLWSKSAVGKQMFFSVEQSYLFLIGLS